MEQTFHDLCIDQQRGPARGFFVLSTFTETSVGIAQEHLYLIMKGNAMKKFIMYSRSAAITSLILSLPLGLLLLILFSGIEPLITAVESMLTVDGVLNVLGRIILFGGMLLLPVAFMLNLRPMLKREGTERKRRLYAINLIVGAIIVLLIAVMWGGLLVEAIYCLRGIRCD
jgi:dolichyl-phosphate-mannose--protein O-mannosyl transferase